MSEGSGFLLRPCDAEQVQLVIDMMNAMHEAVAPFVMARPDDMPLAIALVGAAASRFAGAQYGTACFLGLARPDGRDLRLALQAAATNYKAGIDSGLAMAQRATAPSMGAVQ
jgi:hypothetical protein